MGVCIFATTSRASCLKKMMLNSKFVKSNLKIIIFVIISQSINMWCNLQNGNKILLLKLTSGPDRESIPCEGRIPLQRKDPTAICFNIFEQINNYFLIHSKKLVAFFIKRNQYVKLSIYVVGNSENQAFPAMPWQFGEFDLFSQVSNSGKMHNTKKLT